LVAWIVLPNAQVYILWFLVFAIVAKLTLFYIGSWYKKELELNKTKAKKKLVLPDLSSRKITISIIILLLLIFSKFFYVASITSYFQFYTMDKFGLNEVQAQVYLFYFLIAVAVGSVFGGVFCGECGRTYVTWRSVLGDVPFALLLPHANLPWTCILFVIIGVIMFSAFAAILVYAQELWPKKIGMI